MRIADEIEQVMRAFVAFEDVFNALVEEQGIAPYQAASWFLRNKDDFERMQMLECSLERRDFFILESNWASDYFYELAAGNDVDWEADQRPGFRAGFIENQVRSFFKRANVDFPESAIGRSEQASRKQVDSPQHQLTGMREESAEGADRPLGTRERTTLLTVIAALAEEAKISVVSPSKSAELIASITERMGAPVAKRTIEEHLKRVPDAIERKSR